jgi:DNA-binding transcriptional ArsR family regulator
MCCAGDAFSLCSATSSPLFARLPMSLAGTPCIGCETIIILSHMVQYARSALDDSFAALSDATRRGIIDQLGRADASITSLAEKFQMTLTGMKKHVQVLERAGLVATQKVGRVRRCSLGRCGLAREAAWIEAHRKLFEARFDGLDQLIREMSQEENDGRTA